MGLSRAAVPYVDGGIYNVVPPAASDGQTVPFQVDAAGNLKVTFTGGSASNPAASPTGAAVPASASYTGVNIGGILFGLTGFNLPDSVPMAVAIVNANGDQITSFGGGSQFAMGSAQAANALGTIALGYDGTNVRGLLVSSTGQLHAIIDAATLGTVTVSGSVSVSNPDVQFADNTISGATPTGTLAMGWDSVNSKIRALKVDTNQSLEVSTPSIVDPNNSSITPLGANAVFTGTATDLLLYKAITVAVFADQLATQMQIEWSQNGTNWDFIESFPVTANIGLTNVFTIKARFFRVVYTNGSTPQTSFRLQALMHPTTVQLRGVMVGTQVSTTDEALIVKSVLTAQSLTSTSFQTLKAASGALIISGVDGAGQGNFLPVASNGSFASGNVVTVGGLDSGGNAVPFGINGGVVAITVQTVGADAQSNNALGVFVAGGGQLVTIGSYPSVFNGTTWDRIRSGGATGFIGVTGAATSGASKAGNPVQVGAVFNTTQPTVTTGQVVENQATARGALIVATGVDSFNVAFAAAQHVIVDSGSVTVSGSVGITGTVDVSDRAARLLGVVYGSQGQQLKQTATNFNTQVELATGATLYDARQIRALTSADVVTANQGAPNTLVNRWPVQITDGTNTMPTGDVVARAIFHQITDGVNGPVAVKPASTPALATDPAFVVALSPNSNGVSIAAGSSIALSSNPSTVPLIQGNDDRQRTMVLLECIRRAIVALACDGAHNNPSDFDPNKILQEAGVDNFTA